MSEITFSWENTVNLGLTADNKKLDIFFQPGLSWGNGTTKAIALFFLENDPDKKPEDPNSGMDFQNLVKAMLHWIWASAGNSNTVVTQPTTYYKDLYEAFLEQPFGYANFRNFLNDNFEFRIQEPPIMEPPQELEGTIFPMFPELIINHGALTEYQLKVREDIFEDYGQLLLQTTLQELLAYLPPVPEPTPEPEKMPTVSLDTLMKCLEKNKTVDEVNADTKKSLPNDHAYFNRLASITSRFLLHGIRLRTDPNDPATEKPVFEVTGQQFDLETAKVPVDEDKEDKYTIKLSLPDPAPDPIKFYSKSDNAALTALTYDIELTETDNQHPLAALIKGLKEVTISDIDGRINFAGQNGAASGIQPIEFYRYQKRIYTMHKWIQLGPTTTNPPTTTFLLQVPASLRQFLDRTAVNPTISLSTVPPGQRRIDLAAGKIPNKKYNWAVQIDITVRRVSKTDGGGFLTGVFELADISESQINLLESVILDNHLNSAKIQVLCNSNSSNGLEPLPGNPIDFALIRHNFATNGSIPGTAPESIVPLPAANNGPANKQFLQMLWEGATLESGGYFFSQSMTIEQHQALFASKESVLLSLLIEYDIPGDPIFDFYNTVKLSSEDAHLLENNLLLAVAEDEKFQVPVLAVPPGYIGFKYETTEPVPGTAPETPSPDAEKAYALAELKSLYHLMGYALTGGPAGENTTIGPLEAPADIQYGWVKKRILDPENPIEVRLKVESQLREEPNTTGKLIGAVIPADEQVKVYERSSDKEWLKVKDYEGWLPANSVTFDDVWIYEKLIPAQENPGQVEPENWPSTAPPWEQNPYRGITAGSSLAFYYWWQDIYGNILPQNTSEPFPVRYTDPLIGINQWPYLSEQYQFVRENGRPFLNIELAFSPAPYEVLKTDPNNKEALDRLQAALSTYQKLYYQLHGPGVDFAISTSLVDEVDAKKWPYAFTEDQKNSLSTFVLKIYVYLSGLTNGLKNNSVTPPDYEGDPLLLPIDLEGLPIKNKFIQGISCWMTMQRDEALVHPDLKGNPKLTNIFKNQAVLSPKQESVEITIEANQTLQTLAAAMRTSLAIRQQELKLLATNNSITPEEIVLQYSAVPRTVQAGKMIHIDALELAEGRTFGEKRQELKNKEEPAIGQTDSVTGQVVTREAGLYETTSRTVSTASGDSFEALTQRINQAMKDTLGPKYPVEFRLHDLAVNFKDDTGFLQAGTKLTLEPLNIRQFAQNFTEAFPDFHIAVGEESNAGGGQANAESGRPEYLFAVRLGGGGVSYDIAEQDPNFYAIPPVSTQLFSGKATIYSDPIKRTGGIEKEVEGIDANVLAREFLSALEEMLKPEFLSPATDATKQLLTDKVTLAKKITDTVAPILTEDFGDPKVSPDPRLAAAKEAIHQRLLTNLLEGFDIESIVQYEATITTGTALPATTTAAILPPRMTGKAKVLRVRVGEDPNNRVPAEADDLDYTLSTGYFELDQRDGQSAFTYLFDTKTPDKFGGLELEMEFQPLEMEFNLSKFPDASAAFKSSNKLRFILPANLNVYRIDQALGTKITGLFGMESEFMDSFAKPLPGMVGKKFFSLAEFEAALSESLPAGKTLNDFPYRKYCDALLSDANPNYMGRTDVPIPLRYYPLSPSLILQQAEADESSREVIRDLREWRYTIIYEHPEVAQDSIDCIVRLNVPDTDQTLGNVSQPAVEIPEFVRLLLNFKENLSGMKAAIEPLKAGNVTEDTEKALYAFAFLTGQIATNWAIVRGGESGHYMPLAGDLHFEVSEETLTFMDNTDEAATREGIVITRKGLADADLIQLDRSFVEKDGVPNAKELLKRGIHKTGTAANPVYLKQLVPILELPGFMKDPAVADNPSISPGTPESRTFFFAIDPDDQTFFGDSSIPDRKFSIENLDLLQQQNAWASIWLSRNKNLAFGKTTNPDFIFRTPAVRFTNRFTPSIVNREPWDIATLPAGGPASSATLVNHLSNMLDLFKPGVVTPQAAHQRYTLQIACRYAYAMARGAGLNEDLVTTLPILLGLRLTPDLLGQYPGKLSKEISTWFQKHQPAETNAYLIFSVEAYSQLDPNANASLPLLRVTHLELNLNSITNMPDIRTGNG